ncbi:excinuclease ABC subunit UvrA [Zoogloea sp.]|uniref:excinuclease ABC subunit UvrA n=1 Tax=Zoogloea sp. TaxID=49181 RepID=UPI002606AB3F|nr:excinuclease ABC subunit UvrA [Zoogloea sp.]
MCLDPACQADHDPADANTIRIRGARQNNLKNLSLDIPHHELVVVTGVSGSGKSSLVFDTLYAEGQRRYVETFSPYARQFLDRMDKPQVDRIEGVPPAIAIDQTNPVRTSRSTVGTMTELADHFKLLYARAARLHCRGCGKPVTRDTPATIFADLSARAAAAGDPRLVVSFPVTVPASFGEDEIAGLLAQQGYTRIHARDGAVLHVVQDRFRLAGAEHARVMEALEIGLRAGHGRITVHALGGVEEAQWKFSSGLHCADCDIAYSDPLPSLFSFNSPIGACETCKGFGRVIGVDFSLVVPDESKSIDEGAVKIWQSPSFKECQDDLLKMARRNGVATDIAVRDLPPEHREWLLEGDPKWKNWDASWPRHWYGVRHFFDWLETKAYKMHIRVLLSRYRSYTECPACHGARLKPDALLWRLEAHQGAAASGLSSAAIHELLACPIEDIAPFVAGLDLPAPLDEATELLLGEIKGRLKYLQDVGLGYLTLDRQSRTLSGGEVQRINLTTALGTSLVNTLFVLDEPSIGLHPRDIGRILGVMERLRDAGNSLVVVEHDPQLMLAADRLLDIGPGPGERGGEIVAYGPPVQIANDPGSLTGAYLSGKKRVDTRRLPRAVAADLPRLTLKGARQHNLQGVDLAIPLQRLVGITGVSGSGKSTLIQDVLFPALAKHFGQPAETPGAFDSLAGLDAIKGVVSVDQSPIGKSARSNPVSYVGAWDAIRKLFANLQESKDRGYTPGTFSFNSGTGRCPTCTGSGFEHVEMQFLSDVYLRCPDCDGKRYRPEILALSWQGKGVADVLEMTVSEALIFFADQKAVQAALAPLADVGLEYLRLGQPVPTLSGGEAQRLKLAGHLAEAAQLAAKKSKKGATGIEPGLLFLFDEPTTGLHFEDVATLLSAFEKLLDAGHSLVVIEHNLDVIAAADWLVDLGPEGGSGGGRVVAEGTPAQLIATPASHTGRALADYSAQLAALQAAPVVAEPAVRYRAVVEKAITIRHARHHNLKNISLSIPRDKFTVITGLSGSGKSTLAFDIVFGEGQRRYLESLNAYARQFAQPSARPDVDAIFGIPPTVAIEQRVSRGGRKSTVGTLTEIQPFLRLMYVKLGTQFCPDCDVPVTPQSFEAIVAHIMRDCAGQSVELLAPLIINRKGLYTDLAKWARGKGFEQLRVDGEYLPTQKWPRLDRYKEHSIELPVGVVKVGPDTEALLREYVETALGHGKGVLKVLTTAQPDAPLITLSTLRACPDCGTSFPEPDPRLFSYNAKHGWCPDCYGTGLKISGKVDNPDDLDLGELDAETFDACPSCNGARLNPVARAVRFRDLGLHELASLPVGKVAGFFAGLALEHREAEIGRDLIAEIRGRLDFLQQVGLAYLALDRAAPTLSGGEAQRIRLAAQLGSNLTGVCYILDEPTIGLHPRDNRLLLDTLEALRARGNTLLVVEHDEDTIRRADHVIDIGPGAGVRGGRIVAEGLLADLMAAPESATGRCLAHPLFHPLAPRRPVPADHPALIVNGATLHNLKNVTGRVPLARLTVVTGVSGSGKSTFARDVLHASLVAAGPVGCASLLGAEQIGRVLEVDQTPIGKTPRSCPATYIGFWDTIRKLFAETNEARLRGWTASRFSFNTGAGRCPVCEGQGRITIEMNFLPDVKLPCEACSGARFNPETLTVQWKGKSVAEVLGMAVEDAVEFFAAHPSIAHPLRLLQDVGLGYLTLGQPSPTLSGGEAQRIKLVSELAKVRGRAGESAAGPGRPLPPEKHTLYVLDEPTVGLHMADVEKLIHVLHRLADAGHTVMVIEHDLDLMAEADWIIDLGPEGGDGGGEIVAEGPPEAIVDVGRSHTGQILGVFMASRCAPAEIRRTTP